MSRLFFLVCYQACSILLTSEAGPVWGVHGDHSLGDTGRTANSRLIQGPHPKNVRPPLHQTRYGEARILHWDVIALSPVLRADLPPDKETHIVLKKVTLTTSYSDSPQQQKESSSGPTVPQPHLSM